VDPFRYEEDGLHPYSTEANLKPDSAMSTDVALFKNTLEPKHFKDGASGDCGGLQKRGPITPHVFFVRTAICAKQNA
jgi:hypothetical protein